MATDIDDVMTEAFDAVERAMRTRLADALTEVLTSVADEVDAAYDGDEPQTHADDLTNEDGELLDPAHAHTAVHDAWLAGWERAIEVLREQIEAATFAGWRPSETT